MKEICIGLLLGTVYWGLVFWYVSLQTEGFKRGFWSVLKLKDLDKSPEFKQAELTKFVFTVFGVVAVLIIIRMLTCPL